MKVQLKDKKQFQRLLIKKGFSKNKLAKESNLSQPYIIQLSQGMRCPSATAAHKILDALDIEFDEVFEIVESDEKVNVK